MPRHSEIPVAEQAELSRRCSARSGTVEGCRTLCKLLLCLLLILQTANCIKIRKVAVCRWSVVRNAVTRHTCSTAERRKRPDPAPPSASLLRLHPGVQKCLQSRRKTRYTSPPGKVAPSIPSPPPLLPLNSCIHCSQRVQHGAAAPLLPVQCPLVLRPPGDLSIAWSRSGSRR